MWIDHRSLSGLRTATRSACSAPSIQNIHSSKCTQTRVSGVLERNLNGMAPVSKNTPASSRCSLQSLALVQLQPALSECTWINPAHHKSRHLRMCIEVLCWRCSNAQLETEHRACKRALARVHDYKRGYPLGGTCARSHRGRILSQSAASTRTNQA